MISLKNLFNYALITFVIYATGSVYCVSFGYSTWITMLFVVSAVMFFLGRGADRRFRSDALKKMLFLATCMVLVITLNGVSQYSSYIAIVLQILAAYFVSHRIEYDDFKRKYINIISFLAAVSLVGHIISLAYPTFAARFPMTEGDYSSNYYNAFIHVFQAARGYSHLVMSKRNAGIFWEPGAYQAFLNMGLLFLLSMKDVKNKRRKVLLLALAIVTTGSTTGYIILAFLCIIYRKQLLVMIGGNNKTLTFLGLLAAMGVLIYVSSINPVSGIEKLIYEFTSGHYLERLFLDDLGILFQAPLNLLGISFETYEAMGRGSGNSIVQTMVTLGIPFAGMLLKMYLDYARRSERKWPIIVVLMFIFSTESLLWRPFFLCLAWYGSKDTLTKRPLRQKMGLEDRNESTVVL